MVSIENLQKNTTYIVGASIFTGNYEYWHLKSTKSFKTLEKDDYWPQMILNDTISVEFMPQNDSKALIAAIKWQRTDGERTTHSNSQMYDIEEKKKRLNNFFRYDLRLPFHIIFENTQHISA